MLPPCQASKSLKRTILALAVIVVFALMLSPRPTLGMLVIMQVPEDYDSIAEAIADTPAQAVIEFATGAYREALVITRPLALRAAQGAQVTLVAPSDEAPVVAIRDTESVSIEGLTILGGQYGIFVTQSQNIKIVSNRVLGSRLAGIKVRLGAADILNNSVINAQAPYGFGIAVTEMSHADVLGNTVSGTTGIGINVLDMSIARVCDNVVSETGSGIDSQSIRNGNGITVDYHSEASLSGEPNRRQRVARPKCFVWLLCLSARKQHQRQHARSDLSGRERRGSGSGLRD